MRTLYKTGKSAQVAMERDKYGVEVLGLSEVRWTPSGKVTLASAQLCSCTQDHPIRAMTTETEWALRCPRNLIEE